MKICTSFYRTIFLVGLFLLPISNNAQDLPKPPEPPEIEVSEPGMLLLLGGGLLGLVVTRRRKAVS